MIQSDTFFATTVSTLADPQNRRVWSIIISLFGDLAQDSGAQLSGNAVTQIIEPMGIKPEAIRVALHRLRKDGWIKSVRTGRASMHFLTGYGREQSAQVTPRIYARTPEIARDWHLLIAEDASGISALENLMMTHPYMVISRTVAMGSGPLPTDYDELLGFDVSARIVPDWMRTRIFPTDLTQACKSLRDAARIVRKSWPDQPLTPFQIATLRTLIVHRWRRVILRHPDLPDVFFPAGWTGNDCRAEVFQLLDLLPRPDLGQLG